MVHRFTLQAALGHTRMVKLVAQTAQSQLNPHLKVALDRWRASAVLGAPLVVFDHELAASQAEIAQLKTLLEAERCLAQQARDQLADAEVCSISIASLGTELVEAKVQAEQALKKLDLVTPMRCWIDCVQTTKVVAELKLASAAKEADLNARIQELECKALVELNHQKATAASAAHAAKLGAEVSSLEQQLRREEESKRALQTQLDQKESEFGALQEAEKVAATAKAELAVQTKLTNAAQQELTRLLRKSSAAHEQPQEEKMLFQTAKTSRAMSRIPTNIAHAVKAKTEVYLKQIADHRIGGGEFSHRVREKLLATNVQKRIGSQKIR